MGHLSIACQVRAERTLPCTLHIWEPHILALAQKMSSRMAESHSSRTGPVETDWPLAPHRVGRSGAEAAPAEAALPALNFCLSQCARKGPAISSNSSKKSITLCLGGQKIQPAVSMKQAPPPSHCHRHRRRCPHATSQQVGPSHQAPANASSPGMRTRF